MIRLLVISVFCLGVVSTSAAQNVIGTKAASTIFSSPHSNRQIHTPPTTATQDETELKYYNPELASDDWVIGLQYGNLLNLALGERMTLPWASGYLDSVSFVVDSLQGDSLNIIIAPDTLFDVGNGELYHLINVFPSAPELYADMTIPVQEIHQGGITTIAIGHVVVPHEFFVTIIGRIDQATQTVTPVWVRGDAEPTRTRTAENSRSAMVGAAGGSVYTTVIDSAYILNGKTDIAFTNFYMSAFVSQGNNDVSESQSNTNIPEVFPNPANRTLTVSTNSLGEHTISATLYDALGRAVRTFDNISTYNRYDVSTIASGSYQLVIQDATGNHCMPVSIVH